MHHLRVQDLPQLKSPLRPSHSHQNLDTIAARADEVRKERKKATKHDAAHRLASVLHVDGKDGVEAEFEKSQEFHDAWRLKSQDMLARAAFRRKKLVQRLQVQIACLRALMFRA